MRRQLKPVKRGVERSEDEEKVRRRREQMGGGGDERRIDETKGATDSEQTGQGSVRQGSGATKECTSFNQGCRYQAGSVKWMKCWQLVEVVKQEREEEDERKKRSRRERDEERRRGEANRRARAGGASPDAAGDLQQR